jgi:hypothetical protein
MEKSGVLTITVTTDRFINLGRMQAAALGKPELPLVVIPHPLAGLGEEDARQRGRGVGEEVLALVERMRSGS